MTDLEQVRVMAASLGVSADEYVGVLMSFGFSVKDASEALRIVLDDLKKQDEG